MTIKVSNMYAQIRQVNYVWETVLKRPTGAYWLVNCYFSLKWCCLVTRLSLFSTQTPLLHLYRLVEIASQKKTETLLVINQKFELELSWLGTDSKLSLRNCNLEPRAGLDAWRGSFSYPRVFCLGAPCRRLSVDPEDPPRDGELSHHSVAAPHPLQPRVSCPTAPQVNTPSLLIWIQKSSFFVWLLWIRTAEHI